MTIDNYHWPTDSGILMAKLLSMTTFHSYIGPSSLGRVAIFGHKCSAHMITFEPLLNWILRQLIWYTPLAAKVTHGAHWRNVNPYAFSILNYLQKICGTIFKRYVELPLSDLKYSNFRAPSNILPTSTTSKLGWKHLKRMLNFGFQQVYANFGRIAEEFW